jgi:hypothetical protein
MKVRTVTSSYGFFPMGPFVLKAERRKRTGWLMDQYVTAKAAYPNAVFSFIGHSNGTYLAASATARKRLCITCFSPLLKRSGQNYH